MGKTLITIYGDIWFGSPHIWQEEKDEKKGG